MLISVIIPTYNRSELLPRTLPALAAQQLDADLDYEVVFVDDGSTDDTPALIAAAAAASQHIRCLRIDHTGSPARPRNVGVRAARGSIVVLLDDDVVPDPDLVQQHADFHRRHPAPGEAALGQLYLPDDVRDDPMSLFHTFPYHEAAAASHLSYLFFWTCNVSVKTAFMCRFGWFDEDPSLHPLEDMECGYRLEKAGLTLRLLKTATGCHLHKLGPDGVAARGRRTGRAQAALIHKVPDLGLQRRFGILTREQPWRDQVVRRVRRLAFACVDQPLTRFLLRLFGANRGRRSRLSDFYYYLEFRRTTVLGFRDAMVDWGQSDPPRHATWPVGEEPRA
jgi:glycosyltransferase involved in cell wall biosynthesis